MSTGEHRYRCSFMKQKLAKLKLKISDVANSTHNYKAIVKHRESTMADGAQKLYTQTTWLFCI